MDKVLILRADTEANSQLKGLSGEVTLDLTKPTLHVHDGSTTGGHSVAESVPTKLSQLTDSSSLWTSGELTKVSLLTNDEEFWTQVDLTKVSQLQNDSGYKTGFCQYCGHCTYCQNCGRCNNVQCSQVQCNVKNCQQCSDCTVCKSSSYWWSTINSALMQGGVQTSSKCVYRDC